jgi:hypothetical protein
MEKKTSEHAEYTERKDGKKTTEDTKHTEREDGKGNLGTHGVH